MRQRKNMRKGALLGLTAIISAALLSGLLSGCTTSNEQVDDVKDLTIYSGRSEGFIAPFLDEWESASGISLTVRYGDSAELAAQIMEEGANSPADVFLSQDAGSIGAVSESGLLTALPSGVAQDIPSAYVAADRSWVGVTGRVRVFAYNPSAVKTLPSSITDLTKDEFKNRIGIAPSNASFQAFVTALIEAQGVDFAEKWLADLQSNGVKIFAKNSAIVEAIDKGEIDLGLVNHYYLWEVSKSLGREINVKNGFFKPGDLGNLINVSGVGILKSSKKYSASQDLINFLTSMSAQEKFVSETHEYSLLPDMAAPEGVPSLMEIGAPQVDLESLKNIRVTQDLLVKVGLL